MAMMMMMMTLFLLSCGGGGGVLAEQKKKEVTVELFGRAESDVTFASYLGGVAFNEFGHLRALTPARRAEGGAHEQGHALQLRVARLRQVHAIGRQAPLPACGEHRRSLR
ncbi:hypothetical protein NFJ02_19g34840 [Pycnococcus provasolii]